MKRMTRIEHKLCCALCCCAGLFSCADNGHPRVSTPGEPGKSFVLNYTIPDTEKQESLTRALFYSAPVPAVNADESKVTSLKVLFFDRDDYGNGIYIGMADGTLPGGSLEQKTGSAAIALNPSSSVSDTQDYNVLVIANASGYIADSDLETFCKGKTENRVRLELQARMPELTDAGARGYFAIPGDGLLMSGAAVKEAGKDISVDLLRAAVRIDVEVADSKKDEIVLTEATLRNVSPRIPLFSAPTDVAFVPLAFRDRISATNETVIRGGLYLTEVFRTGLNDLFLRNNQSACLLVNCHKKSYKGSRTWYRVEINLDDDGSQYLKRNNAYTVVISNIKSLGAETADEAYMSDATLLKSVTIPTDWKTPEGVTPPEVDIH